MNLYELALPGEAEGASAPLGMPYAWATAPAAPEDLDAAFDAVASEYGVDADVLRAMAYADDHWGPGMASGAAPARTGATGPVQRLSGEGLGLEDTGPLNSVESIFGAAASLRSRLEHFGGDYLQAVAAHRSGDEAGSALAAPGTAPYQAPPDARGYLQTVFSVADDLRARGAGTAPTSAPAPASPSQPAPAPGPAAMVPRPAPTPRPAPVPSPLPIAPPQPAASRQRPQPSEEPPGAARIQLGAADDPRSLLYRQAPAAQKPLLDEVKSQLASGAKTLAQMLPGTAAAARWVATEPAAAAGKAVPASTGSVLERAAPPANLPASSDLPLRPEARQAVNNAWDASSPQDRQRLQSVPGWQGQLARERAAQFAQADKGVFAASPTAALFDPRIEGRTRALITKGEHPDFARRAAREGAAAGVPPGQEIKALGATVQPSTYDFETKNLFDHGRPANLLNTTVGRGVAKGGLGLGKGVVGISQFIEDLSGADDATKQRTAARATTLRSMEQAIGERGPHLQRNAEGAIVSITQQLPMLVTGSFVPSQLLSMGSIAAQSFGQEYSDGKSRGLDPQQAAGRAGAFAAFEVIGEKFGFKGNLEAIRKATQGMPSDAVAGFLSNLIKKEIPGEVLTATGQFAVDKWAPAGMALKPDATLGDYVQQLGDTITQTVMQGGMMSGGQRVLGGMAAKAPSAPRVQDQSTAPHAPQAGEGTYERAAANTTAHTPPPSPGSPAPAAGYNGEPVPNTTQWSNVATADKKARAEAEILRQAEALPQQEAARSTTTPSATPTMPMPASTDTSNGGTQQGANALLQKQVNSGEDQAETGAQASATDPADAPGTPAPAPPPSTLTTEADAGAAETVPATTQHGTARHTAASQVQPPAPTPIDAQIQALDSGMLVVGGDQATILSHLQAGGVRGAEPFAGVTLVSVDQAALAQRVLGRPLAAPAGTVGTQAVRGSQRASATATLPGTRIAAQLAPTAARAPTAGGSTAGPSAVGASAPRTEGRHGSPASAAASQPVPVRMEMQRDGTLMVKGDPVQLQERLRQGGVERVLRRKGGVLVGLDQVGKARQLLQQQPPRAQTSAGPILSSQSSLPDQQFSRSAPDQASRSRGLPTKPATVQSVKAAVAKLTNSMGLLAEGRGRVVVATSADIKAHWEPLIGEVDMGSQDTGLAQGFFDPNTNTVFLIADHIEAGQEMAVAAHELVHKHGKAVLGEARWRQLHEVIGTWANRPEGSLERQVYDEAMARVQTSRPNNADAVAYSSEELFPYAVQVAMERGVQPTALMPANSVQGWLARVRASLKDVLGKLTGNPQAFDGQHLVDLAFGIAQQERAGAAAVRWQGDLAWATGGSESPSASSPSPSSPLRPLQMSRDATGKDGAGAAKKKGPLGSEDNPRPVPLTDFKVRITTDNDPSNAITMLVDGEEVDFSSIEIKNGNPVLVVGKNGQKKSGEHVIIDAHGVTEAMLKAVIYYHIETKGTPPVELPGSLADDNRKNFRKEFDKHRKSNHNGTENDWAQAAIRDISFGKARQKLGYGAFEIKLSGSVNVGYLKGVPEEINVIARRN